MGAFITECSFLLIVKGVFGIIKRGGWGTAEVYMIYKLTGEENMYGQDSSL